MKKTLVTIAVAALTISSFAQGTVNVLNNLSGTFRAPIYGPQAGNPGTSLNGNTATGLPAGTQVYSGPLLQGSGFTFAVYYGAATVTDPAALTLLTSAPFRTGSAAGLITSQLSTLVPGTAEGGSAKFQVRAWDNENNTKTYDNATFKGASPLFLQPLGGGVLLATDMTGWTSFNIYAVPEPATFALAGLGAAALLIFRRRK